MASADKEAALSFPEKLKKMIEDGQYCSKTIFNVDETGLFWKKMPRRTFIAHEEKTFPRFKAAKDRLTVMLGGNAASDCKLKPLLIYRSENPRALKNKSKAGLPVIWRSNAKARVTASVFEDRFGYHFIPEAESYCHSQNLPFKVMLILDNAPGHPPTTLVDFDPRVKVVFLPPNTSLIQPMDQGAIKTFKAYYTRRSFAHLNAAMKQNNEKTVKDFWKTFNVLDAVRIIGDSWAEVCERTMNGVWKKLCPFLFSQNLITAPEIDHVAEAKEVIILASQLGLEVDAEDFMELLDSHNEELALDDIIEIHNQNTVEVAEEAGLEWISTMTVGKLTEGLELIEAGLKVLEEIDSNEDRAATARQGIKKAITCYKEILWEKKKSLSRQTSLLDFLKSSSSH